MPREGVFTVVEKGGIVRPGDEVKMTLPAADRPFTAAVVTLSDKGFAGEREDKSGPLVERCSKKPVMRWLRRCFCRMGDPDWNGS